MIVLNRSHQINEKLSFFSQNQQDSKIMSKLKIVFQKKSPMNLIVPHLQKYQIHHKVILLNGKLVIFNLEDFLVQVLYSIEEELNLLMFKNSLVFKTLN